MPVLEPDVIVRPGLQLPVGRHDRPRREQSGSTPRHFNAAPSVKQNALNMHCMRAGDAGFNKQMHAEDADRPRWGCVFNSSARRPSWRDNKQRVRRAGGTNPRRSVQTWDQGLHALLCAPVVRPPILLPHHHPLTTAVHCLSWQGRPVSSSRCSARRPSQPRGRGSHRGAAPRGRAPTTPLVATHRRRRVATCRRRGGALSLAALSLAALAAARAAGAGGPA